MLLPQALVSSVVNVNITDQYNASSPLYVTDEQVRLSMNHQVFATEW